MSFYRMHDRDGGGMIATPHAELPNWNRQGFGIFASVQAFDGPRRIERLKAIRAWAVDIDDGSKEKQRERIERSPLKPSSVVETKNGYHVYFYALNATPERYRAIVDRLVEYFVADRGARDLARVLRVPGFMHMKDPDSPFLVRRVWGPHKTIAYSEREMMGGFPPTKSERKAAEAMRRNTTPVAHRVPTVSNLEIARGEDFWNRVFAINGKRALERLSGHPAVNAEVYTFRKTPSGFNVLVNGKGSSAWIDRDGRIGSHSHGGPSVLRWLNWFGLSNGQAASVIKEVLPEVKNG